MNKQRAFEMSRRKALASLGAVGVASAGAGFGTSAYLSDTESFDDNALAAGELDLKVDWTEHYSDGSDDESDGIAIRAEPGGEYDVGFPAAAPEAEQSVFVKSMNDARTFLANTAVEAFPDVLDEGDEYDARKAELPDDSDICDLSADLDGGDGVLSHPYRTRGTFGGDPNPQTTEAGDPLVNISDVNPGDFGEVTFGFHVCGNPGYVWLTGELVDASENGLTQPELEADGEDQTLDGDGEVTPADGTVELLDEIQVALWYDTGPDGEYGADFGDKDDGEGDNYRQDGEAFIPVTGSLRNVLRLLQEGMVPLDYSPTGGSQTTQSGDGPHCVADGLDDDIDDSPFTNGDFGDNTARNISCDKLAGLLVENGYVEAGTEYVGTKFVVGGEQGEPVPEVGSYPAGNGGTIVIDAIDVDAGTVTISTDFPVEAVGVKGGNEGQNNYVFEDQGGTEDDGVSEQFGCVVDGVTFSTSKGNAISNIKVCYDPDTPTDGGDPGTTPAESGNGRECFPNSTTAYVGFEWWLPVDVGNEVQGDSVTFDLGFYTEQCRHNGGSGQTAGGGSE